MQPCTQCSSIDTLENYYDSFMFFVQVAITLYGLYNEGSNIEFINHDFIERFIDNYLD